MGFENWSIAEAKAKFSDLVDKASAGAPQMITRHGREAVVVVSVEEWARKSRRVGNLAEFFAESPLRDSGIDLERLPGGLRDIDL
jgi:prevent-host-death family protein